MASSSEEPVSGVNELESANDSINTRICVQCLFESLQESQSRFEDFVNDLETSSILQESQLTEVLTSMHESDKNAVALILCDHVIGCSPTKLSALHSKEWSETIYCAEAKILHAFAVRKEKVTPCTAFLVQSLKKLADHNSELVKSLIEVEAVSNEDTEIQGWGMNLIARTLDDTKTQDLVVKAIKILKISNNPAPSVADSGKEWTTLHFSVVSTEIIEDEPDFAVEVVDNNKDKMTVMLKLSWDREKKMFYGEYQIEVAEKETFEYSYVCGKRTQRLSTAIYTCNLRKDIDLLDVIDLKTKEDKKAYTSKETASTMFLPKVHELQERDSYERVRNWMNAMQRQEIKVPEAVVHWIATCFTTNKEVDEIVTVLTVLRLLPDLNLHWETNDLNWICKRLMVKTVDQDLNTLRTEVLNRCQINRLEVAEILVTLFKKGERVVFLNWVLILPLYWLFTSENPIAKPTGNCLKKTLPADKGINWQVIINNVAGAPKHDFEALYKGMKKIGDRYPWNWRTLAAITPRKYFVEMLKHNNAKLRKALMKKFLPGSKLDSETKPAIRKCVEHLKSTIEKDENWKDKSYVLKECQTVADYLARSTESCDFPSLKYAVETVKDLFQLFYTVEIKLEKQFLQDKLRDLLESTKGSLTRIESNLLQEPTTPDEQWLAYCNELQLMDWPEDTELPSKSKEYFYTVHRKFWEKKDIAFIDLFKSTFSSDIECSRVIKSQLVESLTISLKRVHGSFWKSWMKSRQIRSIFLGLLYDELKEKEMIDILQSQILDATSLGDGSSLISQLNGEQYPRSAEIKRKILSFVTMVENKEISLHACLIICQDGPKRNMHLLKKFAAESSVDHKWDAKIAEINSILLDYHHFENTSVSFSESFGFDMSEMDLLEGAENCSAKHVSAWLSQHAGELLEYRRGVNLKKENVIVGYLAPTIPQLSNGTKKRPLDWWKELKDSASDLLQQVIGEKIMVNQLEKIFAAPKLALSKCKRRISDLLEETDGRDIVTGELQEIFHDEKLALGNVKDNLSGLLMQKIPREDMNHKLEETLSFRKFVHHNISELIDMFPNLQKDKLDEVVELIIAALIVLQNRPLYPLILKATCSGNPTLAALESCERWELERIRGVKDFVRFENVGNELEKYLMEFDKQKQLVEWLRNDIKDLNQLMTLTELMMSNNVDDRAKEISELLSAARGFSPILFIANNDDSSIITAILNLSENIKVHGFITYWQNTGMLIHRYKEISAFYASGDKKYLSLVENINEHGVYHIKFPQVGDRVSYSQCVRLEIAPSALEENDKGAWTLTELRDQHANMLLMTFDSARVKNCTKAFSALLDAVEAIAQELVILVNLGCLLFRDWSCRIRPSGQPDVHIVEMQFNSSSIEIKETLSSDGLMKLSRVMGQIAEKQQLFIQWACQRHYFLNEYSMKQCNFLCTKLPLCRNGQAEDLQKIQDLLSLVLKTPSTPVSLDKINESLADALRLCDEERPRTVSYYSELFSCESAAPQKEKAMIEKLVKKKKLKRNIATAAVQKVGCASINECFDWATSNLRNEKIVADLNRQYKEKIGFKTDDSGSCTPLTLDEIIKCSLQSADQSTLFASIETASKKYYESTITMTGKDYLSLEHLGKFLTFLKMKLPLEQAPDRKLVTPLKQGVPNLVICSHEEVLVTSLALYAADNTQPLPSFSEVLVCSESTEQEEVERFTRRSLLHNGLIGQPLHCLAFADRLSFKNQRAIETMFSSLSKSKKAMNSNFQLVIIASSEKCYLGSCFYKHKVSWKYEEEKCKAYLADKLALDPSILALLHKNKCFLNSTVRTVTSKKPGQGKSLCITRLHELLSSIDGCIPHATVRCIETEINTDEVMAKLCERLCQTGSSLGLIHLDISSVVKKNLEQFLFNLVILGKMENSFGTVWLRKKYHLYALEILEPEQDSGNEQKILHLIPNTYCASPKEASDCLLKHTQPSKSKHWDTKAYMEETFQRPFSYFQVFNHNSGSLDYFKYVPGENMCTFDEFLSTILDEIDIADPTWAQLRYFCSYLNYQLTNCENSDFCDKNKVKEDLPGLKKFAIKHLIATAKEFSTITLQEAGNELEQHKLQQYWDHLKQPFLFFNDDGHTMTFVNIERWSMDSRLHFALEKNFCFDKNDLTCLNRRSKLTVLHQLMDIRVSDDNPSDPDPHFKLTPENVLKIMAIHVRLKSGIPLVIMGETGCGKTKMIEFMCKMKGGKNASNMKAVRIHGGVTKELLYKEVKKYADYQKQEDFVLFFDEANTTLAVHAIKEVMCDRTINGIPFENPKLHFIAACNPYREMSITEREKLWKCGLGYAEGAFEVESNIGPISIRNLVYRVVALPSSMRHLVWDFGRLSDENEKLYIQQMVEEMLCTSEGKSQGEDLKTEMADIISSVQRYMRTLKDECKYVSLRDVERCILVYRWLESHTALYEMMESRRKFGPKMRTLLLAVSICYYMSLDDKPAFLENLALTFQEKITADDMSQEILAFQKMFVKDLVMEQDITCNEALRENIFMMAICFSLKIPLFIIGKPGSSKSLAKSLLAQNMTGKNSSHPLWSTLNQVQLLSYQCSVLTDVSGIQKVFSDCRALQKANAGEYTAVAVLDEIGLAEASPNMPLKVLHPLIEPSIRDCEEQEMEKVGFLGISNWVLDPSKMNRGIFVKRNVPSEENLQETAQHIFQCSEKKEGTTSKIDEHNFAVLKQLTVAYQEIFKTGEKDFFGLRDFYSMVKMIAGKDTGEISPRGVGETIIRNFSGGDDKRIKKVFEKHLRNVWEDFSLSASQATVCSLIKSNLNDNDSRYLLLLTKHLSSVWMLKTIVPDFKVIFGSEFPGDQTMQSVYQDITEIKTCMEAGRKVIILNQARIHEPLYDVLNQHYTRFGDQRYVDIGIGQNHIKCRVERGFRIIILEEEDFALSKYPIPLLNRMEKHRFASKSLDSWNRHAERSLSEFLKRFVSVDKNWSVSESFVGFQDDSVGSVLHLSKDKCKEKFLQFTTTDAVLRSSFGKSAEHEDLQNIYFNDQNHDSLVQLLSNLCNGNCQNPMYYEIVTFDSLLSEEDRLTMETRLNLSRNSLAVINLLEFSKKEQFLSRLECLIEDNGDEAKVVLIQCPHSPNIVKLVECAKFCLLGVLEKHQAHGKIICLILTCERPTYCNDGIKLQPSAHNEIIYIDQVKPLDNESFIPSNLRNKSLAEIVRGMVSWKDLRSCVASVIAQIASERNGLSRNSNFSEILPQALEKDHRKSNSFFTLLCEKIAQMQEASPDQSNWALQLARDKGKLCEGGSFVGAAQLELERCLSRSMSQVLISADQNKNIELLSENASWISKLWLQLFQDYQIGKSHGIPHLYFEGKFPFSFWIASKLEEFLYGSEYEQVACDFKEFFGRMLHCLNEAKIHGETIEELLEAYTHDMVKLRFSVNVSAEELKVLHYLLIVLAEQRAGWRSLSSLPELLPWIFCIVEQNLQTFKQFAAIGEIFPEVFSRILEKAERVEFSDINWLLPTSFEILLSKLSDEKGGLLNEAPLSLIKWMECMEKVLNLDYVLSIPCFKDLGTISHEDGEDSSSDEDNSQLAHDLNDHAIRQEFSSEQKQKWKSLLFLYNLLHDLIPAKEIKYFEALKSEVMQMKAIHESFQNDSEKLLRKLLLTLHNCYDIVIASVKMHWESCSCFYCSKTMIDLRKLSPCGHFLCTDCLGQNNSCCVYCLQKFSKADSLVLDESQVMEVESFQSRCCRVFLHVLDSSLAESMFRENLIPITVHSVLLPDSEAGLETSFFSKDLAAVRSLLMTLKRHPQSGNTDQELDKFLSENNGKINGEIINELLYFFESDFFLDMSKKQHGEWLTVVQESWNYLTSTTECLSVRFFRHLARVRTTLQMAALTLEHETAVDNGLIQYVRCICKHPRIKEFLTKTGFRHHGSNWLCKIVKKSSTQGLFSEWLISEEKDNWICAEGYAEARRVTASATDIPHPEKYVKNIPKLLVNLTWMETRSSKHPVAYLVGRKVNIHRLLEFLKDAGLQEREVHEMYQLIGSTAIAICSQGFLTGHLRLADEPGRAQHLHFPGMPESKSFLLHRMFGGECSIWKCPNGHMYGIGDCKRPYHKGACPDCKLEIGGQYHDPSKGNQKVEVPTEQDQAGYYIAADEEIANARMSSQVANVLHFLLHCSLLLGCCKNEEEVEKILTKHRSKPEGFITHRYLIRGLISNICDLASSLSKNRDETILLLHKLFFDIAESKRQQAHSWGGMEDRNQWEEKFHAKFLKPWFDNMDSILIEEQQKMAKFSSDKEKVLCDAIALDPSIQGITWEDPKFWVYLKTTGLEDVINKCEATQKGKVLPYILKRKDICLLKYLKAVVKLQTFLVARYQGYIEPHVAEAKAFEVRDLHLNGKEAQKVQKWKQLYIEAWNLFLRHEEMPLRDLRFGCSPMDEKSVLSMFLPSERGCGRLAKYFIHYLVDLHNGLLNASGTSIPEVDVDQMSSSHYIAIQDEKELIYLVQTYTSYKTDVEKGDRYHKVSYSIDELEQKVMRLYVCHKRKLNKKSILCMRYPQDINTAKHWREACKENAPQDGLDSDALQEIDALIELKALKELCSGVTEVANAVTILAKKKEDSKTSLRGYLLDFLRVEKGRVSVIPNSFDLKQVLATYAHLTWHKAQKWVKRGISLHSIYSLGSDRSNHNTNEKDVLHLKGIFQKMEVSDLEILTKCLNEMIISRGDHLDKAESLIEIIPYFEFLNHKWDADEDTPLPPWFSKIPCEITFGNIVDLLT